jgi:DNA-binding response OmpR family regulator
VIGGQRMPFDQHGEALKQAQILLVEDRLDLAEVIIRELEAAGYNVAHVTNGESALQFERLGHFQLVILDWMLPGMNGLDVLRNLRAHSPVAVLMLTARDAEMDRVLGLEVGADDYLTKPFSMRELIARVRAMLRRRELIEQTMVADKGRSNGLIYAGNLRLEPDAHLVMVHDEPIDLTRTEFALLYLLVSNSGRVFSRAYLVEMIWSADYIEGDRSVDNAVMRLRKKLKSAGECIEAVWGVGYRWKRECPN